MTQRPQIGPGGHVKRPPDPDRLEQARRAMPAPQSGATDRERPSPARCGARRVQFLVLAAGLLGLGQPAAWAALAAPQRQALIELYQSTQGPAWRHRDNWLVGDPCNSHWHGVGCSPDGQVVRSLSLPGNHLQGRLPESFSALNTLETVDLRGNMGLSGTLPPLTEFPALTQLNLSFNQFSGPIPRLSHLVRLQTLVLSNNLLTGPLPELSGLPALQTLRLNHNQLSGPLPSLTQLSALQSIDLSFNHFEGHLPEFAGLSQLASFQGDWNRFDGPLPPPSGLLHLHTLLLSGNQLSGELPPLRNLPALTQLALDRNRFSGPLPHLNDLTALSQLNLAYNQFTGPLPELSRLRQLKQLQVEGNQLSGALPDRPPQLSQATLCPNLFTDAAPLTNDPSLSGDDAILLWQACQALPAGSARGRAFPSSRATPADGETGRPPAGFNCSQTPARQASCAHHTSLRQTKPTAPLPDVGGLPAWSDWVMAVSALLAFVTMVLIWRLSWLSQGPQAIPTAAPEGQPPHQEPWLHSHAPPPSDTTRSFRPRPSWPPS